MHNPANHAAEQRNVATLTLSHIERRGSRGIERQQGRFRPAGKSELIEREPRTADRSDDAGMGQFGPASISNLAKTLRGSFLGKYGASLSW